MNRVSIWDLDYYYAKDKSNCFNPDVMKISSYHKQLGDKVNFVMREVDINRPFDIYYIIKENNKTPNPPFEFFTNSKVKWWGNAYKARIKWSMSDAMLGCRPDYLLYPEYDTTLERSEQLRLFNDKGELLPHIQDYSNTFKRKRVILTDTTMWTAAEKDIIKALEMLKEIKNITFLKPIWLEKLINNKTLRDKFFELKLTPGANVNWSPLRLECVNEAIDFIYEFKKHFPHVSAGTIILHYMPHDHWLDKENALNDFEKIKQVIIHAKEKKVVFKIQMPIQRRLDTPYFFLFETICEWTENNCRISWLEYLGKRYKLSRGTYNQQEYWNKPQTWNVLFRDLLRQTWEDRKFLLMKWGDTMLSQNDIPWQLWQEEFKIGL